MEWWQSLIILAYGILALVGCIRSFYECKSRKNTFGHTYINRLFGAFVWADMVIFGLFWSLVALISYFLQDWILFLLTISLFWLIRSVGETIYWFNQQFSTINRNPVSHFKYAKKIFHNDSIWFVYQIFWQCMTVVATIASLYLANRWL